MRTVAILPARYSSSRFPGKPLADINGKTMIQVVYERVCGIEPLDDVIVATDDERIFNAVKSFGGKVVMTSNKHTCGTDRAAECAEKLGLNDDDIIINVQGDEPLIKKEMIYKLIELFNDSSVYMGTLKKLIVDEVELENSNVVKVITDVNNDAIYFSRYCIPYERDSKYAKHYKHIGIYGYKKWFLLKFSNMNKMPLEETESLEQLRVIENGYKIRVGETIFQTIGVDTPEQLEAVKKKIKEEYYE